MAGGLDHLVVVAKDIDAQVALYERLGFQVGARNRHSWGTLNNIVQFDGVFLELLTTEQGFHPPPADEALAQFTGPIVDYLSDREGLAMMVLEGFDASADHQSFHAAGIGVPETLYFARQGRRPDGEPVEVAFSLAFAKSPGITAAGFFVCQQHAPEMFWNPAFQIHPNGAKGVARIVMASPDPARQGAFFEAYTGTMAQAVDGGLTFQLPRGAVDVLTPAACAEAFGNDALPIQAQSLPEGQHATPRFVAIEFDVEDATRVANTFTGAGVSFDRRQGRIIVPASAAMGVTLAFREKS